MSAQRATAKLTSVRARVVACKRSSTQAPLLLHVKLNGQDWFSRPFFVQDVLYYSSTGAPS
jgi:hypothetical protein